MKKAGKTQVALMSLGVMLSACAMSAMASETSASETGASATGASASGTSMSEGTDAAHGGMPEQWQFFDEYCGKCHNSTDWAGGVAFDTMLPDEIGSEAEIWEETVRKLRGRLMPPPDKPQPDQAVIDAQVAWLESKLDAAAAEHPHPGSVVVHRLNRTEYEREIKRLLGLDIDAAAYLPKDTKADGFDNVAAVLKVSPSFLDAYIVAAHEVSTRALGNADAAASSTVYRVSDSTFRGGHIDGLPLGTRGGMLVEHLFPADGDYVFNVSQSGGGGGGYVQGLDTRHRMIVTVDGEKVFEQEVGGEEDQKSVDQKQAPAAKAIRDRFNNIEVHVPAGPHKIGVTWVARSQAQNDELLEPFSVSDLPRVPFINGLEVVGPQTTTGLSDTPSRRKIFQCYPKNAAEEGPCARQIVTDLARRAYRRPVTDADLAAPMKFFEAGREDKGFEGGVQQAIMAVLASPKFLYRVEAAPADVEPGSIYRISDVELASRLSFFLWSQGPDEELLSAAVDGKLRDDAEVERQVKRMLADPRSRSLTTSFADQWLTVGEIDAIEPDPSLFPEFDGALREAFRKEMELFVDSVFSEDQNVMNLLGASYTYLNERLALHYGIPNVRGDRFRRVALDDTHRYGILGKGAFLMGMSYANRTSPVRRGAWVMEQLIGAPPAAPPPGVEALKENMNGLRPTTVRERMIAHRQNPTCNSCHGVIDPIGFSLENFDAIGEWRTKDREAGTGIESDTNLHGVRIDGPDELRQFLLSRPDQFVQTLTIKLMTYALGRGVEAHDMPTVRSIVREAGSHDYRFSAIITGIVKSDQFTRQSVSAAPAGTQIKTAQASTRDSTP